MATDRLELFDLMPPSTYGFLAVCQLNCFAAQFERLPRHLHRVTPTLAGLGAERLRLYARW
jgi:hypothetical protein